MNYAYKVEYIVNDDGDTTILKTKKALKTFTEVVERLNGEVLRVRKVIITD